MEEGVRTYAVDMVIALVQARRHVRATKDGLGVTVQYVRYASMLLADLPSHYSKRDPPRTPSITTVVDHSLRHHCFDIVHDGAK